MDAFFASIEQRDNPELRGKPVIVGGAGSRGVVAAASYEVRKFGVHSAMPSRTAHERCPAAIFIRPRIAHYRAISKNIFRIFEEYTPLIEGLSLDEAFLDVSASIGLYGNAHDLAVKLKKQVFAETALTVSVGIGPNKLTAKICSARCKPDGLLQIKHEDVVRFLGPLPVDVLFGIGRKTNSRLNRIGIRTVNELRNAEPDLLRPILGRFTNKYQRLAKGEDNRPVEPTQEDKSVSSEETFATDISNRDQLATELLKMCESVATRLRQHQLLARTVTLKLRTPDFTTATRSRSFEPPTSDTRALYGIGLKLLDRWLEQNRGASLRLLGMGTSNFREAAQADLFGAPAERELDKVIDDIRERFGKGALRRGKLL